jgi:hypothetical protein
MIRFNSRLAWYGAALLMVSGAVALMGQDKGDATNTGSLAALTAEVRQLRLALEESTRTQTQTQALGVYLSVQQSRLVQVESRLDAVRKELDGVTVRAKQIAAEYQRFSEMLRSETNPEVRADLGQQARAMKLELENMSIQDQQVRLREAELSQLLQAETSRWTDLVTSLEKLIRK